MTTVRVEIQRAKKIPKPMLPKTLFNIFYDKGRCYPMKYPMDVVWIKEEELPVALRLWVDLDWIKGLFFSMGEFLKIPPFPVSKFY